MIDKEYDRPEVCQSAANRLRAALLAFCALVAVDQLAIGIWMIRSYRHCGVWAVGRGAGA